MMIASEHKFKNMNTSSNKKTHKKKAKKRKTVKWQKSSLTLEEQMCEGPLKIWGN